VISGFALMTRADLRLSRAAPAPAGGFVSRRVTVGGDRLHLRVREAPGGTSWLLLHGLAVSHRYLMPTAAALPGSVYVPDLPGFGLSGKPRSVYGVTQQAAVAAALLDHLGRTDCRVLGNSFGCQVAVELAIQRPDLVAELVLVGPTADPAAATMTGQILRWLRDLTMEDPRQLRFMATDIRQAGLRRILRTLRHSVRHSMPDRLPLVPVPVLFLRGEHDPIVPRRWLGAAARITPDSRTGEIARAAHNAVTTAGRRVAAAATDQDSG
jgi:pimeloyl-ACP methyl ester carboxylesterase